MGFSVWFELSSVLVNSIDAVQFYCVSICGAATTLIFSIESGCTFSKIKAGLDRVEGIFELAIL